MATRLTRQEIVMRQREEAVMRLTNLREVLAEGAAGTYGLGAVYAALDAQLDYLLALDDVSIPDTDAARQADAPGRE